MDWFPKTGLGRLSFYLALSGLFVIVMMNVLAQNADCGLCPDGYRLEGEVCQPECGYATPACLMSSIEPVCDLREEGVWRIFRIVAGLAAMLCVLASGVISSVAVFGRRRERAVLVLIPVILGLLGLAFVLGEIFIPH